MPGFNIALYKYPSIKSRLTQDAAEYEDISLLGVVSIALYPAEDDIKSLVNKTSLIGGDGHSPEDAFLGGSTTTDHTSAPEVKQAT